jgi:hypothetical protein
MAVPNPFEKEYEVELPQLKPIGVKKSREILRRKNEEEIRKNLGVSKHKTAVFVSS